MATGTERPEPISSLVGSRQVEMAILCLGSLERASPGPVQFRLHDDGTLNAQDRSRLTEAFAGCAIVTREEGDDLAVPLLARRPALRAFRDEHPLALKLIDVALGVPDTLAYCDTDVLFLRRFSGLFQLSAGMGARFMSDRQNAYSLRSWHLLRRPGIQLPRRANTGIMVFRMAHYDPDLLEWYLSRPEYRFAPVWVEQTAWALLGWRAGCDLLDPSQVAIPLPDQPAHRDTVALHFVSSIRAQLSRYALAPPPDAREPVATVRSTPALRCTAADLAADEGRRLLHRWFAAGSR